MPMTALASSTQGLPLEGTTPVEAWSAFEHLASGNGLIAAIGSLSWRPMPGTRPVAAIAIEGFRKDFNTAVTRCRGTPERPGLVLGLEPDRTATAFAMLLAVETGKRHAVWSEFRRRELDGIGYVPTLLPGRRRDSGEVIMAAVVLADTRSPSYFRGSVVELAAVIRCAAGDCGTNLDYARQCLAADRAIHGKLSEHLAALEQHLSPQ